MAITNPISCILNQYSSREERLLNHDTDRMMSDTFVLDTCACITLYFSTAQGPILYNFHPFFIVSFYNMRRTSISPTTIPNYIFRPKYTGKYDIRNMVVVWFCLMVVTMNWCMQSTTSTTSSSRSAWSSAMTTVADRLLFSGPFFISLLLNWLLFLRIYLLRCFRPRCTFIFWFGCSWFAWRII